jgi:nucleoside-diphosphate-sugar epimerase
VQVLVLGGTGSIGAPVIRALVRRGHQVLALTRSAASAQKVVAFGAQPVAGNIRRPEEWLRALPAVDAVIHAACEFEDSMEAIERHLLDHLLPHLAASKGNPKFIYTGGCWLFGATGDQVATETTPFRALPAFAWAVPHIKCVLETVGIEPTIIHPAMVYAAGGGVFSSFARDAVERRAIRIVGNENVRWPLVHSDDLASLYALVLERDAARESYIGAAIDGFPVGRIARAFAKRSGAVDRDLQIISADAIAAELGEWARGYALDQQASGAKARLSLGWDPKHLDPDGDIAAIN